MFRTFCSVSTDYLSLLRSFEDPSILRSHQKIIQFPFLLNSNPLTGGAAGNGDEKTEEELARITERRREQGRKLQEIAARNRIEKVRVKMKLFHDTSNPSACLRSCNKKNQTSHTSCRSGITTPLPQLNVNGTGNSERKGLMTRRLSKTL